jgi:hypothetical protein
LLTRPNPLPDDDEILLASLKGNSVASKARQAAPEHAHVGNG